MRYVKNPVMRAMVMQDLLITWSPKVPNFVPKKSEAAAGRDSYFEILQQIREAE